MIKVGPLASVDAAQLLFDNASRQFTCGELRVESGCSHAEKMKAMQKHPALLEAKGHPGTLVRGSPVGQRCPNCFSGVASIAAGVFGDADAAADDASARNHCGRC